MQIHGIGLKLEVIKCNFDVNYVCSYRRNCLDWLMECSADEESTSITQNDGFYWPPRWFNMSCGISLRCAGLISATEKDPAKKIKTSKAIRIRILSLGSSYFMLH